jgi:TrmH family RNA methyltransferase
VVAAAVILDPGRPIAGLNDSKKLSARKREALAEQIRGTALAWGVAEATAAEIDQINILQASLLAMQRAVAALTGAQGRVSPSHVLVDGTHCPSLSCPVEAILGGDGKFASIAAASILAKTFSRRWHARVACQPSTVWLRSPQGLPDRDAPAGTARIRCKRAAPPQLRAGGAARPAMRRIASRDNAHYKALLKLARSSRERRKSGRVLLDGMHLIAAYEQHYGTPEEVLVSESGAERTENARYLESRASLAVTRIGDALFDALALVDTPSGIMAVVARPQPAGGGDHAADAVLLDGVQDPGNLGSILRSAAAAGFHQILLSADCAQAWSPKTLRAAMGAHFQLAIHEDGDLSAFLTAFRGQSVATLLAASSSLYSLLFADRWPGCLAAKVLASGRQSRRSRAGSCASPWPVASESLNVAAARRRLPV